MSDDNQYFEDAFPIQHDERRGLTKREYMAAMAMQGILAGDDSDEYYDADRRKEIAKCAVDFADALLAELAKGKKDE